MPGRLGEVSRNGPPPITTLYASPAPPRAAATESLKAAISDIWYVRMSSAVTCSRGNSREDTPLPHSAEPRRDVSEMSEMCARCGREVVERWPRDAVG